jgi:hypothetical protein
MRQDVSGLAVMDLVPLEERLAEAASVFYGTETIWEAWAVFQGAELAFRIRIVVGDMRTAVGLDMRFQ